jgi:tetratricopeptide (TPR) repeat protein
VAAITAYGRARDKMPPESRDSAVFWDRYFGRQPAEQIAVLNAARNQLGEAEKFARETYRLYDALDKKPPLRIGLILAQALLEGGSDKTERDRRATEALHLLDDLQKRFPADAGAAAVRARALTALGRGGEVAAALASIESGPRKLLTQADVELAREDYAAAAETLRKVFDDPDASARELRLAVSLYVQCMRQLERESDARGVIAALRTREPPKDGSPEEVRRLAKSAEVILSEPDAAKRLDKLAELLKETTDPVQRAWGLADLYSRSDQIVEWDRAQPYWEKAQSYLDEWERLQPDSLQPKEWQFVVALRIARRAHAAGRPDVVKTQLDRAARYIVPLTDPITAPDKVGGAIYRGELALMQAQLESAEDVVQQFGEIAVREFQQAIRTLPRTSDLQMKLARALVAAGKLDDGAAAARTAAEINPRDFSAHRFLFLTYDRLAQGAKAAERAALEELARRHFELAQALNAKDPDVVAFAQMIEDRKQPEKAIARREDRRQRNPGDLKNVLELGRACQWMWEQKSRAGDTAGAVDFQKRADECYQSVAAAAPTDFEWLGTVLEFYVATRERRKGEEVLRNFSSKLKGMQRLAAQIALANFYEKLGDFAAAEQAYRAAQVRDEGGQIIESELIKEAFSDPGDRLRAEARIGFELISLFNRAKMFGFKEEKALEGALYEADRLLKRIGLNPRPGEPEVVNAYRRQARLFLAEGLMRNTKYEESDAVLSAYRKDYADDLRGLRLSIELRLRRKDIDKHDDRRKASEELTEYLKLDPTDGWALYNRGLLKMQMGEYLDARQDFEAALQGIAEPQLEIKARSLLAGVDEAVGDNMPAIEELKRVLELVDARDNAILRPRVVDRLLRLLAKEKRDEAALELLSSYGQRRPDEPYWAMRTGRFLEDRGDRRMKPEPGRAPDVAGAREDYLRAANKYAEAVRVSGGNTSRDAAGAVAARINVLAKADHRLPNDVPEALQLFESIAATDLSSVVRVAGAAALARYKKRDEALRQYETAMLQADLEGLGAALYAADSMRNAFSMAEAEELLRALCTRLPADKGQGLRLRAALATQCVATDKPKDALETLRPVIESRDALRQSAAEDSFGLWSESMVLCGRAYDALQDYAAAEKTYNVLLAEDPEHVVALNNLAWLLAADLNRPREAVEHAERARELSRDFPDRSSILDTVGVAYLRNDRLEDARRALEEAIRLDPATYSSYEHMADVLVRLKQPSEARDWLLRGVAAARNDKAADWERKLNDKLQKLP